MILHTILMLLAFIGYHSIFFSYTAYIFNNNKNPIIRGLFSGTINFIIWYLFTYFINVQYEPLMIVFYVLILSVETKLLFRSNLVHTIFIAITFSLNLFAKRLAIMATIALMHGGTITSVVNTVENRMLVAIIAFALSMGTINLARNSIPRIYLDTILADNKNITFITSVFTILVISLVAFTCTIDVNIGGEVLLYHYIVTGGVVIATFAVFIVYAYFLADLRIATETYKQVSKENETEKNVVKELEKTARTDDLTGLNTREYGDDIIEMYMRDNINFFVAFIDIDGLKIVNDEYGHDEGDYYIVSVSNIVKSEFTNCAICRYGGDEFVVIGKTASEEETIHKLVRCYANVNNVARRNNKTYTTSISYGVAHKYQGEKITGKELLAIADNRMYELKKKNNRHRKTVRKH